MGAAAPLEHTPANCRAREVLDRVGDRWSLYVILNLGDGTRRFTELKRSIDGISQRMLTVTLKGLERDGIVCRTMYPVMPPRVDYTLTPVGRTLIDAVGTLFTWAEDHLADIDTARARYDEARQKASPPA
jgi:DNA-binding HxlR family transcriptional regulator